MVLLTSGYIYKRLIGRLDRQDSNTVTMEKALGVLVAQVAPMSDRITIAESNIKAIDKAQAVLEEHVRLHDEWARDQAAKG